jgi:hypothetical protein
MILFDKHRKARNNLSAYIDGQLAARDLTALEAHLEACEACRLELRQLRATIVALGAMPQAEPRRSFRLTPAMAATPRPAPRPEPRPALANGVRIAAVGLAAALAIVVVVDAGDSGGGGDDGSLTLNEDRSSEADGAEHIQQSVAPDYQSGGDILDGENAGNLHSDGSAPDAEPSNGDDSSAGGDRDEPPSAPVTAPDGEGDGAASDTDDKATENASALDADDGGFDTLLAVEIALGAALALAVAGAAWLTFVPRIRAGRP